MPKVKIYKFTNLINGKIYVGSTINVYNRLKEHRNAISNEQRYISRFYQALRKYGWESFMFDVIEECCPLLRNEYENKWINYYHTLERGCGYNLMLADLTNKSEETKQKMSEKSKGRQTWLGKHHTQESKDMNSRSCKESYKNGRVHPFKDQKLSEDHVQHLKDAHKTRTFYASGHKATEETKKKQSLARLGVEPWNKGKKQTPEQIQKMKDGWKRKKMEDRRQSWLKHKPLF